MAIKPIRSDREHGETLHEIERLWGAPRRTARGDKLDVLLALVEAYERAHHPVDPPDPIDAIRFRLEQAGLGVNALTGVIGSRTRVYEVLRGDRPLTLAMIRRLNEKFGIPAEVLIRPVAKGRRRAA